MLASIATIAAAISALIGVGYGIYAAIKKAKKISWENRSRELEKELMEAVTDEQRAKLAKSISDHRAQ